MANASRIVLALNAAVFAAIGAAMLLTPELLTKVTGTILSTPAALDDFRAVYGGLHLALAAGMIRALSARERTAEGLFLALAGLAGLTFGRTWSIASRGHAETLTLWLLLPEIVGVVVNGAVFARSRRGSSR